MSEPFQKEIEWIIGAFKLIVIAAVLIFAAYAIISSFIPQVPLWIAAVLLVILAAFVYSVRDKIKNTLGID